MSTPAGSPFEMPDLPRLSDGQSLDAATAEGLLAGRGVAAEAPPDQQALARVLEALGGPASDQELATQPVAVATFVLASSPTGGSRAARHAALPGVRRLAWLALAAAAGVTAVCGTAAAGALPAPVQELAHVTFGAPAPHHGGPLPQAPRRSRRQGVQRADPASRPGQSRLPGIPAKGRHKLKVKVNGAHPGGPAVHPGHPAKPTEPAHPRVHPAKPVHREARTAKHRADPAGRRGG